MILQRPRGRRRVLRLGVRGEGGRIVDPLFPLCICIWLISFLFLLFVYALLWSLQGCGHRKSKLEYGVLSCVFFHPEPFLCSHGDGVSVIPIERGNYNVAQKIKSNLGIVQKVTQQTGLRDKYS